MIRSFAFSTALALMGALGSATIGSAAGVDIGDKAPPIQGVSTEGKEVSLDDFKDAKAVVVIFTCNKCPVAQAYEKRFIEFADQYGDKGVALVAVNVNPESLDEMKARAEQQGFNFPYIKDESGESARKYGATVTPHLFVLDREREVAYIGSFDDDMTNPQKKHLENAVDAVLSGEQPETAKTKAFGCGIKLTQR